MPLTFSSSRTGFTSITVTPVNGSLKLGGGHDDRGGGKLPGARAGFARNGSCDVVVLSASAENKNQTIAQLKTLVSPVGEGDISVSGTVNGVSVVAADALVDVEITGDSVQTATISWKGTYPDAQTSSSD